MYFNSNIHGSGPIKNGTTIVAAKFDTGIIIGADSRLSYSNGYIGNRICTKLIQLANRIWVCMSGTAADAQAIIDQITFVLQHQSIRLGRDPLVKEVAHRFRQCTYENRDSMTAHFIVAGWDCKEGSQIYEINLGGMLRSLNVASGGSGDQYTAPILNAQYKANMDISQCSALVVNAIKTGMKYDPCSGGVIRLCIITEDGVDKKVVFTTKTGTAIG